MRRTKMLAYSAERHAMHRHEALHQWINMRINQRAIRFELERAWSL